MRWLLASGESKGGADRHLGPELRPEMAVDLANGTGSELHVVTVALTPYSTEQNH